MPRLPVYLDHNATTPCDPRVVEAILPYFSTAYGNAASRQHFYGWQAEEAVENAREQVAMLIGAGPKETVFTSGATEAVNLAIKGVVESYGRNIANGPVHIITCSIEHNAVLDTCRHLEKKGAEISYLPVQSNGILAIHELEAAIKPNTVLIAIMYANNEIGTVMPVKEIGAIAKKNNILFFSDATQAAGKLPIDVDEDGIDLLAFSAHKIYGPKGTGALYVRRKNPRVKITAQIDGGGHERGMRSGTLNVPGIVGFGKACSIYMMEREEEVKRTGRLRDKLEKALLSLDETYLNGDEKKRLPHTTNIAFRHIEGNALLADIGKTIAVSTGSACTSASLEPSHVLKAIGLEDDLARSSLRFGLGRFTTEEEIDYTIEQVTYSLNKLRTASPAWELHKGS